MALQNGVHINIRVENLIIVTNIMMTNLIMTFVFNIDHMNNKWIIQLQ